MECKNKQNTKYEISKIDSKASAYFNKDSLFQIVKAPAIVPELWKEMVSIFNEYSSEVHYNEPSLLKKWNQIKKQVNKQNTYLIQYIIEALHERKDSIIVSSGYNSIPKLQEAKKEFTLFCIHYLSQIEKRVNLESGTLSMIYAEKPSHALRLLRYHDFSKTVAHFDSSIMTCLYYEDGGLQLKIDGQWVDAPKLSKDEILIMYGVPGEILSNSNLRSVKHRVKNTNKKRLVIAYFHNAPKIYDIKGKGFKKTTMFNIHQEAQLWYAGVNARLVRKLCKGKEISWYIIIYAWIANFIMKTNDKHISSL